MNLSTTRTQQQRSIAKTQADIAWQDMYRKRVNPKRRRSVLRHRGFRVTFTMNGRAYHPTKGYRSKEAV